MSNFPFPFQMEKTQEEADNNKAADTGKFQHSFK